MKPRYLITIALILALIGLMAYRAYASSVGPNGAGTGSDDNSIGSVTWSNPGNITASDTSCAQAVINTGTENTIKIIKGGVISGTNKSTGAAPPSSGTCTTSMLYATYGGASDLWGVSWTYSDINASNFGIAASYDTGVNQTHYLDATNFGFSIPAGSTINGIKMEIQSSDDSATGVCGLANCIIINYVRATITYTTSSGTPQVQIRSGTIKVKSGSLILK